MFISELSKYDGGGTEISLKTEKEVEYDFAGEQLEEFVVRLCFREGYTGRVC